MIISEIEYKKLWKEFDGMTFTPVCELIEEIETVEIEGEKVERNVFKYKVLKTADEVYAEYLKAKDEPLPEETSLEEQLTMLKEKVRLMEQDMADILLSII